MSFEGIRGQPLHGKWMVSSLNNHAWIEPPNAGTSLPRRLFHCLLDDQPDHLVPARYLQEWEEHQDRPLFFNPDCWIANNGQLPDRFENNSDVLNHFAREVDVIWIKNSTRDALLPFWLGAEFKTALAGLRPGDRAPASLSSDARRILAMAEVLVPADHEEARNRAWDEISQCALQFKEKRYAPVGQLIHPFHISALRRYYRHLIRQREIPLGDSQSQLRYATQNEPVARFFHHQLTQTVSSIVQQQVKPSYVYLGAYQGGAELEAHIDREQCEFSISLCIDYSPEPARQTPWPLHLQTSTGKTTVFQGIGDGLIYCGRELPHSRDPLALGNTSTSIFFHYVPRDFQGPLT